MTSESERSLFELCRHDFTEIIVYISSLDLPLTVREVADHLHEHAGCLPVAWSRSVIEPFRHLQTLRDLLGIWYVEVSIQSKPYSCH